jgi:ubiquinone/menaquinone biosynthesis C-methylase UbiE
MNTKVTRETRSRVCTGLHGQVVELGFGSGLNAPFYPPDVAAVFAVEPSTVSMHLAEPRIEACAAQVEPAGLTGERLDLPSDEFDAVLSTWTLCTIPDIAAALDETRRVLKPEGRFHFVEHGHSPDADVARWQGRLEPLNKRAFGGCHLTRRIAESIERAGFALEDLDAYYERGTPKPFAYTFEGHARKR